MKQFKIIVILCFSVLAFFASNSFAQERIEITPLSFDPVAVKTPAVESAIVPKEETIYTCGNSFEISYMQEAIIVDEITRKLNTKAYESIVKPKDSLFEVRIRFRNTSMNTYAGFKPETFKLTGYLLGKPKTYTPVLIQEVDYRYNNAPSLAKQVKWGEIQGSSLRWYFGKDQAADISDLYVSPDVSYSFFDAWLPSDYRPRRFTLNKMEPLRMWDLYIAFDVYPKLENWEFSFEPQPANEKIPEGYEACHLNFLLPSWKNELTPSTVRGFRK